MSVAADSRGGRTLSSVWSDGDAGKIPLPPYGSLCTHQCYSHLCFEPIFYITKLYFYLFFIYFLFIFYYLFYYFFNFLFYYFYDAITSTYIFGFIDFIENITALPPFSLFRFPLLVHLPFL